MLQCKEDFVHFISRMDVPRGARLLMDNVALVVYSSRRFDTVQNYRVYDDLMSRLQHAPPDSPEDAGSLETRSLARH
jgi:hypothetical protein